MKGKQKIDLINPRKTNLYSANQSSEFDSLHRTFLLLTMLVERALLLSVMVRNLLRQAFEEMKLKDSVEDTITSGKPAENKI